MKLTNILNATAAISGATQVFGSSSVPTGAGPRRDLVVVVQPTHDFVGTIHVKGHNLETATGAGTFSMVLASRVFTTDAVGATLDGITNAPRNVRAVCAAFTAGSATIELMTDI